MRKTVQMEEVFYAFMRKSVQREEVFYAYMHKTVQRECQNIALGTPLDGFGPFCICISVKTVQREVFYAYMRKTVQREGVSRHMA